MKIVIIIPTYNEAENIEGLIKALQESSIKFPQHQLHLLVVDDNSPDGTGELVKKLKVSYDNLSLLTGEKHGLGQAYLRGMDYATKKLKAEVMFEIDADFQHDPYAVPNFIDKIDQGFDFVIGSRYIKGGSIPSNWGLTRKILSKVGNLIVRAGLLTFSIHDWTSGYRAIRSWVYKKNKKKLQGFNGYTFQVAFLYEALNSGVKIVEIPIHFGERKYGKSKIGSEYVKNLLTYLAKTRIRETTRWRFFKFAVVGGTGFVIQTVIFEVLGVFMRVLSPTIATIIGGQVAILSNYILNNLWTFKDKIITNPAKLIYKFLQFWLTSNFAVLVLQAGTVRVGELLVGENKLFIQGFYLLGIIFTLIWNYTIYNRLIWKTHKK
jgi:dolichol-phosphate mannosyltransferase